MKKAATIFAASGIAALGLAACGGSDDKSSDSTAADTTATAAAAGPMVTVSADPGGSLKFTSDAVDAKAGANTIELDNPASTSHDLVVESSDGEEVGRTDIIAGDKASFNADLAAGTYKFFCDLPGHEQSMHGTITVK